MPYRLTPLGVAVLALLRDRPMHGYEMFQRLVERQSDRIVKVRPGSLYHVVDRLADQKLIRRAATSRHGNRPERAIYEITDAGVEALIDRVRELVATPTDEFPPFVTALAEIHHLDADTAADALTSRVAALEADVAEMMALRDANAASRVNVAALDYVLATTQVQVTWLREFAGSLKSGDGRGQHGTPLDVSVASGSEVE
ncbi:MAG TPA: PadR family transcriptional regulator [Mycobacterium sp.]|uniref:PadR family transcriptional regulator n=1 Tax=Mycobacterium sp. TaxID=1785 RepID=UPI002D3105C7|nr:PadR family transcriptional regulator [Mycobacterium sp.]HZU47032.1 PadR family transcriptional regulator [Mycobacterium sp.]